MKKIIDILGIVLPALIIILGIIRVFVKKTRGVNGLTMFFAILLLLCGLIRYFVYPAGGGSHDNGPKPEPEKVSQHSAAFNQSLENVMNAYYSMTDGFVKNDTAAIGLAAANLKAALDSFRIGELKVDSIIYQTALQPYANAKAELASIIADPSLAEKRGSLNIFSNELFNLVNTARYDLTKLYWQECDKAFGEDKPGNWISKTEKSANPYGQDECADIKVTIDHVPADNSKKAAAGATNK
jgi:hypothetical protein